MTKCHNHWIESKTDQPVVKTLTKLVTVKSQIHSEHHIQ